MSAPTNAMDTYTDLQIAVFEVVYYAGLVLVVVSFPIYCTVVAVLLCGKRQASSNNIFFRVYMIGGIVDITAMLNNYLLCAFPQHGWFIAFYTSNIGFGQAYLMISWSIRYSQGITVVLLAFNRLTAVVFPAKYKTIWTSRVGLIVHCIQLIPPSCVGATLALTTYYYGYNDQGGVYAQARVFSFADNDFRGVVFMTSSFIQTIFVIYIIINYVVVFVYFRKQLRGTALASRNDVRSKEKQKQENRLLFISIAVCSLEVLSWLYSVYAFVINTKMQTRVFYCIFNFLSDVYSCTPPYLLILFSTPFQKRLRTFLRLRSQVEPSSSTSSTITNRDRQSSRSSSRH